MSVRGWQWLRCFLLIAIVSGSLVWLTSPAQINHEVVRIGTADGPQGEIMEYVSELARQEGIEVKLIMTNDYVWLDEALDDGEIDLNATQNLLFLERQRQDRGYDFAVICRTVLQPMGIYSQKLRDLNAVMDGAKVALPQDPLNCSRALQVLADSGLIELQSGSGDIKALSDISSNPHQLSFQLMEAEMAARSLPAVDIAVVNIGFAELAGLSVEKALFLEGLDSVYAGIIISRGAESERPVFERLRQLYQSAEVKAFIEEKFKGSIVAVW